MYKRIFLPEYSFPLFFISFFSFIVFFLQHFSLPLINKFYLANSSRLILSSFILSIFLCAYPLKKRDFHLFMYAVSTIIIGLIFGQLFMHSHYSLFLFCLGTLSLCLILESCLPSLLTQLISSDRRGMTMGFHSTLQSVGIFLGGWAVDFIHSPEALFLSHFALYGLILLMSFITLKKLCPQLPASKNAH